MVLQVSYHMLMTRVETLIQFTQELRDEADAVARETDRSRSALVRDALRAYLDDYLDLKRDRELVESYRRDPPVASTGWAHANAHRMTSEESW